jgi:hypothetical protein
MEKFLLKPLEVRQLLKQWRNSMYFWNRGVYWREWELNVYYNKRVEGLEWIRVAHGRNKWRNRVNTEMDYRVS